MASIPIRFGRYPAPDRTIVHLSDTHILAGGAPLPGGIDTLAALERTAARIAAITTPVAAIVVTGDVSDDGSAESYALARGVLAPVADRLGAALVWAIGNHDERAAFRDGLTVLGRGGGVADDAPFDAVTMNLVDGLRIIAFDTTEPGFHHGALGPERIATLAAILRQPAPGGTILAVHHAPIPSTLSLMDVLELRGQDGLADALAGSDVRLILGGHLHYPVSGSFAGIPVSVAGATAYTLDASAGPRGLVGIDGGRSFNLVELRGDAVTVAVVPVPDDARRLQLFDADFTERLEALDDAGRIDAFSRKP